jgi:hypothetical protein
VEKPIMKERQQYPETDPRHHTVKIKDLLLEAAQHARDDVDKVQDPRARALFETTSEVLKGLVAAYEHLETKSETAWK